MSLSANTKWEKVKLDISSWQTTFVKNEGTNQYHGYNVCNRKTYITQDWFFKEHHPYYWKALNMLNYLENDLANGHDFQFADITNSADSKAVFALAINQFFYSVGDNISEKLGKAKQRY